MKAVFIETSAFTEWVGELLPDDVYAALQQVLMDNPTKGDLIKGCGGLRKIRVADPLRSKGKRGGARAVYLYVPEVKTFYMLDIYGKAEKDDLNAYEKKELTRLVEKLKSLHRHE
ncbi:MAG: hypothetical protein ACKVT0_14660 [Planctomycetaceae bacterium]